MRIQRKKVLLWATQKCKKQKTKKNKNKNMTFVALRGWCSVCNPIQYASQVVVGDAAEWQMDESTWKFSNSTVLDVSPVGDTRRILQVGLSSWYPFLNSAGIFIGVILKFIQSWGCWPCFSGKVRVNLMNNSVKFVLARFFLVVQSQIC